MAEPTKTEVADGGEKKFDVKKALDKKGFVEFLAAHPDSLNNQMTDLEDMQEKFETFEKVGIISKKYREVMSGKIQEELGLKLSPDDFDCVDSSFQEMAINAPDELLKIQTTLKDYEELPVLIASLDKAICEIGGSAEQLTAKRDDIATDKDLMEKALKTVGFGRIERIIKKISGLGDAKKLKEEWSAREIIKDKYTDDFLNRDTMNTSIDGFKSSISNLNKKIDKVSDLVKSKSEIVAKFNEKRTELFEGMRSYDDVIGIIKRKVEEQMDDLLKGKNIKDFEKAHDKLAKLRQSNEKGEFSSGILNEDGIESDQGKIDEELRGLINSEIHTAVDQVKMGAGVFSKLEKTLSSILKMNTLGSKTPEETKAFMVDVLNDALDFLDMDSSEDKAKRLLILRIKSTLE